MIKELDSLDDENRALDIKSKYGALLSDAEIQKGAATTSALVDGLKRGGKKGAALRPWFKL